MHLLDTIDQLRKYVIVSANLTLESIAPAINRAEQKFLKVLLGEKVLQALIKVFDENEEVYKPLIALAQDSCAQFALYLYVTPGGVQVDDSGIYQLKGGDKWRLSDEEIQVLKQSYLETAMDAMETLIAYLEANAVAPAENLSENAYTVYHHWYKSAKRTERIKSLITDSATFEQYVELHHSALTFHTMRTYMANAEKFQIMPLMGEYYEALLNMAMPENNDAALLALAQEALAKLAAAAAVRRGFHCIEKGGLSYRTEYAEPARELLGSYQSAGRHALERLRSKLEELKPSGYTALPSTVSNVLRKPGRKIILA